MGQLTIGPLGIDTDLDDTEVAQINGHVIALGGDYQGASLAETQWFHHEIAELFAMPGSLVPITWAGNDDIDGFYRVVTGTVDLVSQVGTGYVLWSGTFEKIGSSDRIDLESKLVVGLRQNAHSITTSTYETNHVIPTNAFAYDPETTTVPSAVTRKSLDGDFLFLYDIDPAFDPTWGIAAANFYDQAVKLYVDGYRRVGRNAPPGQAEDWSLHNGLVKIEPNGTNLRLDVSVHNGTAWESETTIHLDAASSEIATEWQAVSILRNDPARVSIRLVTSVANGGRRTLDLSLGRGQRFIECLWTNHTAQTLKIERTTGAAATSITGGVYTTANDGDGNRLVLGSSSDVTKDTTNTGISLASTLTLPFFVGFEFDGSSAQSHDAAADLVNQYHAIISESIQAIIR